jgi:hypothetical protein
VRREEKTFFCLFPLLVLILQNLKLSIPGFDFDCNFDQQLTASFSEFG